MQKNKKMSENNNIKEYHDKLNQTALSRERVRSSEDDHQLEFVAEINGVTYINDSKSIRLSATRNSLEAIDASVILIIGGNDKDNDYSLLSQQIKKKVVAIIYLGNESEKMLNHYLTHKMMFAKALHISESISIAAAYAKPGNAVLFSPACENYQAFDTYKSRGNEFKEIVKKYIP
jgi:UDP-N-acetylmuramoylalanine--D-glutamate ligase